MASFHAPLDRSTPPKGPGVVQTVRRAGRCRLHRPLPAFCLLTPVLLPPLPSRFGGLWATRPGMHPGKFHPQRLRTWGWQHESKWEAAAQRKTGDTLSVVSHIEDDGFLIERAAAQLKARLAGLAGGDQSNADVAIDALTMGWQVLRLTSRHVQDLCTMWDRMRVVSDGTFLPAPEEFC